MRKRTLAREIALQALYQHDLHQRMEESGPGPSLEELEPFIQEATDDPEVRQFTRTLLDGTLALRAQIDEKIVAAARNWKLSRIAPVDRSVLRLAIFELMSEQDVPPKVAINEAIELAKKYSTEQSGAFVNGILDRIYNDLRGQQST
jgi:transcription antitermination factor NusB